ncbi:MULTISPECIES: hypothetical protein [unclassified Moorena]|uniref:hypothetical protein n=1 Tax=unclassified Moorena TaxID=2683338 RepID=UPI0013CB0297|nr:MULTISPECIES: hypothetical protein [unclassified Moorena]NEO14967.1 hypothetical protein [Moorena sp. SIO3E8]NEO23147.1 hypothetical protein [Moorena sp. SIO4A5]NEQ01399.1 hypothetical protein [Moorena sp. SIO3F7]
MTVSIQRSAVSGQPSAVSRQPRASADSTSSNVAQALALAFRPRGARLATLCERRCDVAH